MRAGDHRGWLGLIRGPRPRLRPAPALGPSLLAMALVVSGCTSSGDPEPSGTAPPSSRATATPQPTPDTTPSPPEPPFSLRVDRVDRVLLKSLPPNRVRRAMGPAVGGVRRTLTQLHRRAFLSEEALQGRFAEVMDLFAGEARGSVRRRLGTLTLGRDAPQRFTEITGGGGWLRISVLLGRQGGPVTATATSLFRARAVQPDGGAVVLQSRGTWFLRPGNGGWTITGFSVRREDHRPNA